MHDLFDPEQLTYFQYCWLCFFLVVLIFALCCYVDLHYQFHMMM